MMLQRRTGVAAAAALLLLLAVTARIGCVSATNVTVGQGDDEVVCAVAYATPSCHSELENVCFKSGVCLDTGLKVTCEQGNAHLYQFADTNCTGAHTNLTVMYEEDHCSASGPTAGNGFRYQCGRDECALVRNEFQTPAVLLYTLYLVLGALNAVLGYRLFYAQLFFGGFVVTAGLVYVLLESQVPWWPSWQVWVVAVGVGVVGGYATMGVWKLGVFCLGALFGSFLLLLLVHVLHPSAIFVEHNGLTFLALVLGGITFGIVALQNQKPLIVLSTAITGAYAVMRSIDYFAENNRLHSSIMVALGHEDESPVLCWYSFAVLALWPIFTVAGAAVQFRATARGYSHTDGRLERPNSASAFLTTKPAPSTGYEQFL